ncbi:YpdA family putative bacillithiol disulfide reductase [Ornithinibacillus sp. 4-3]|uniref:YpdA family putative bacillithiol disulfide reductase n=1 Tax=Ornithinibacillus sp. 4-3 TaxID=3231488 RepID=A0AB39HGC6_9BACI
MSIENTIIIGAGPCGMSCALELQARGINPLIIEKGNIVHTIYNFPTHQEFFSTSEKLEIGNIPFITERQKPVRSQALAYYRMVAMRNDLRIHSYEEAKTIHKIDEHFQIIVEDQYGNEKSYTAKHVIIATGYYNQFNLMDVEGEDLPKVSHYFKEAHPFYKKKVVIVGGKNSAVDAALELHKAGAEITVLYRGDVYSSSIKPWILPFFDSLVRNEEIQLEFNAKVSKITPTTLHYQVNGQEKEIENDFVFAMTGYQPNIKFLTQVGVDVDFVSGVPVYNEETYETNIPGIYIAGVVAAGFNNNAIFIENGRFHGEKIAESIIGK